MEVLQSQINPTSATFKSNMAHNLEQVRLLRERLQHVREGGGARAVALHRQRGKLLARERIDTSSILALRSWSSQRWRRMTCTTTPRLPPALSRALVWCTVRR